MLSIESNLKRKLCKKSLIDMKHLHERFLELVPNTLRNFHKYNFTDSY